MKNVIKTIEEAKVLDGPSDVIAAAASRLLRPGRVKDLLNGKWQGHPLHPLLTDLPIGFWGSSLTLDLLGGKAAKQTSDRLVALGVISSLPTAASGLADWVDTYGDERRVGAVHALGNIIAIALYAQSYMARRKGKRARGLVFSAAGAAALTLSGFLGGHLVYRLGSGVDQTRFEDHPEEWTAVTKASELKERVASPVDVGKTTLLLYRDSANICAISDRCSHRGAPLHEGEIDREAWTVTCPWHGSVFELRTGKVLRGPASAPQPAYEARIAGDKVQVRRRPAGESSLSTGTGSELAQTHQAVAGKEPTLGALIKGKAQ